MRTEPCSERAGKSSSASDKLVDRLRELGYTGRRPPTEQMTSELIRECRERPGSSLREVSDAIDRLQGQPRKTWSAAIPALRDQLKSANQRESDAIQASRATTTTKWDRELELTRVHVRLKRAIERLQLRAD